MREETPEQNRPLKSGYTTGACATATSYASACKLLGLDDEVHGNSIEITLPRGQQVKFVLENIQCEHPVASASTIKDAGDDPDVTHEALIGSSVELVAIPGVQFKAGNGVGTITLTGLSLDIGEAAINPVPRRMIREHLQKASLAANYSGGYIVTISVENGEALAKKTMNSRLGIVGGLSILGTTGIVRPFSCSAYIASIHQGIDVARQNGQTHLVACTGSSSEQVAVNELALPEMAIIEMGDFADAFLKYYRRNSTAKLSLYAGFGKLCKLADGHLSLHSGKSSINFQRLAEWAGSLGANTALCQQIETANTSLAALALAANSNIALGPLICEKALAVIKEIIPAEVAVEVVAIDRQLNVIARAR